MNIADSSFSILAQHQSITPPSPLGLYRPRRLGPGPYATFAYGIGPVFGHMLRTKILQIASGRKVACLFQP